MDSSSFITIFVSSIAFGAIIGAYMGTVDYRIRHNISLITSQCFCPQCHHVLPTIYQIPIISWIALRGKCHFCHTPIPVRYPLIESGFLTYYGITFLVLWKYPFRMLCSWFGLVFLILLLRCQRNFISMIRGAAIFALYHFIYAFVLLSLYAALNLI